MRRNLKWFMKQGLLVRDNSFKFLHNRFLAKARNNLITMNLLHEIGNNKKVRELLKIPEEYTPDEWIVITGYYAMYASALALIAKIGFRSKSHTATILVLEESFVKKNLLDNINLQLLEYASLKKEEIEELSEARQRREIAQYSITKATTKEIADELMKNAKEFLNKCDEILTKIH